MTFRNSRLRSEYRKKVQSFALATFFWIFSIAIAQATEFLEPWKEKSQAIVLDAYEKNPIDWQQLRSNKQVAGFIAKSSDGMPPPWRCLTTDETEFTLCKKTFQNHWLKKQLYHSRKLIAKSIGLKWGAYHLGRPGNPIEQANHFVDFTDPDEDDLLALDIEHDDPEKWISFKDAEAFVKHVKFRTGRYPVLYTNHITAKKIAARRAEFPILSRLPLWYARYKPDIRGVFPMGNWKSYALWQFSSGANCNNRRCLYRVKGTRPDIDVNIASMTISEIRNAWPFGDLLPFLEYVPDADPELLMAEQERDLRPKQIVRFTSNLTFENSKGKRVKLSSIAVPTSRNASDLATSNSNGEQQDSNAFELADLEADLSPAGRAYSSTTDPKKGKFKPATGRSYGYSNKKKSTKYSRTF